MTATLQPYTRQACNLTLTVEPYVSAGHGVHDRTWIARVDLDVPEFHTRINFALKRIDTWRSEESARARAINLGHAMLVTALIAGVGNAR